MSGSVNKVTILGNLAKDPEVKTFANGGKVINMRVITSESWRDKQTGERKEKAEGHTIVVSNENMFPYIEKNVKKGTKVYLEGRLETRSWDSNDGSNKKNYATEILIRKFGGEFKIVGQPAGSRPQQDSDGGNGYGGDVGNQGNGGSSGSGYQGGGDLDDEIPF